MNTKADQTCGLWPFRFGKHVKAGLAGAWMVNPDALERLLSERAVAS